MTNTYMDPDTILVELEAVVRDEGTVVLFEGISPDTDEVLTVAADHRMAQNVLAFIETVGPCPCLVESWQITRRRPCARRNRNH